MKCNRVVKNISISQKFCYTTTLYYSINCWLFNTIKVCPNRLRRWAHERRNANCTNEIFVLLTRWANAKIFWYCANHGRWATLQRLTNAALVLLAFAINVVHGPIQKILYLLHVPCLNNNNSLLNASPNCCPDTLFLFFLFFFVNRTAAKRRRSRKCKFPQLTNLNVVEKNCL